MKSVKEIFRSYAVFDEKGRHINGTDKQSNHNYGDAYESLFEKYDWGYPGREAIKLVLEIGVADGSCLLAWTEVFPNATVVGMDIHECARAKESDRIEFYIADQLSREGCEMVAANRQFDLIIEDATHKLQNTLLTLFWLWPYVKPGGLYIVEEWEDAASDIERIKQLWPNVEIIGTSGPHIQDEPLIVFRKPIK